MLKIWKGLSGELTISSVDPVNGPGGFASMMNIIAKESIIELSDGLGGQVSVKIGVDDNAGLGSNVFAGAVGMVKVKGDSSADNTDLTKPFIYVGAKYTDYGNLYEEDVAGSHIIINAENATGGIAIRGNTYVKGDVVIRDQEGVGTGTQGLRLSTYGNNTQGQILLQDPLAGGYSLGGKLYIKAGNILINSAAIGGLVNLNGATNNLDRTIVGFDPGYIKAGQRMFGIFEKDLADDDEVNSFIGTNVTRNARMSYHAQYNNSRFNADYFSINGSFAAYAAGGSIGPTQEVTDAITVTRSNAILSGNQQSGMIGLGGWIPETWNYQNTDRLNIWGGIRFHGSTLGYAKSDHHNASVGYHAQDILFHNYYSQNNVGAPAIDIGNATSRSSIFFGYPSTTPYRRMRYNTNSIGTPDPNFDGQNITGIGSPGNSVQPIGDGSVAHVNIWQSRDTRKYAFKIWSDPTVSASHSISNTISASHRGDVNWVDENTHSHASRQLMVGNLSNIPQNPGIEYRMDARGAHMAITAFNSGNGSTNIFVGADNDIILGADLGQIYAQAQERVYLRAQTGDIHLKSVAADAVIEAQNQVYITTNNNNTSSGSIYLRHQLSNTAQNIFLVGVTRIKLTAADPPEKGEGTIWLRTSDTRPTQQNAGSLDQSVESNGKATFRIRDASVGYAPWDTSTEAAATKGNRGRLEGNWHTWDNEFERESEWFVPAAGQSTGEGIGKSSHGVPRNTDYVSIDASGTLNTTNGLGGNINYKANTAFSTGSNAPNYYSCSVFTSLKPTNYDRFLYFNTGLNVGDFDYFNIVWYLKPPGTAAGVGTTVEERWGTPIQHEFLYKRNQYTGYALDGYITSNSVLVPAGWTLTINSILADARIAGVTLNIQYTGIKQGVTNVSTGGRQFNDNEKEFGGAIAKKTAKTDTEIRLPADQLAALLGNP